MNGETLARDLIDSASARIVRRDCHRVALIGATETAVEVRAALIARGWDKQIIGIFDPGASSAALPGLRPWAELVPEDPDLLVICSDHAKEVLMRACADANFGRVHPPEVVLAGMGHLEYHDGVYAELDTPALVPSYATGHPYTRIHLFQCLDAAAQLGLSGAVVELGAFKGGTTAWLASVVKRLGLQSRVIAFDSWEGFPPRRSLLDLYSHPRCVFTDLPAVRNYLTPLGVELVEGDIANTAPVILCDLPILLAFVDTDNYSGARAALETIQSNVVPGGAVVLDHYWTTPEYLYTIGERMAADEVLRDGFLQLHGTGVFLKLR